MALEIEQVGGSDLNTCGEVRTILGVGNKQFFLSCKYCEYICLKLEDFIQHIDDEHLQLFINFNCKRQHNFSHNVRTNHEKEDVKNSETFKESTFQSFENVVIDNTTEMNNDCNTNELVTEISQGSFEEEKDQFDEAKVGSVESSDDTDSYTEVPPTAQHNLWDKQFDLPEHKKKAKILKREAKKKFIIEFIEVYRSLPALWNLKSTLYFNRQIKSEQYEILIKKFKEKYPSATRQDVVKQINSLRSSYKKELRSIGLSGISTLYYFDAMHFIRNITPLSKSRNRHKIAQATSQKNSKKFPPPIGLLNNDEIINLAQIYKSYPCLWDENDIAYRFANRRREALKSILDEINKTSKLKLTYDGLEREISLLRKACSFEKKEKIACKRNKLIYKPTCPYFDYIKYLECDVSPYQCSICDKIVSGSQQHKIHEASHDGSLPFKCQICGHGFKLTTNLAVHLRRHAKDFTYKCAICEKPCATTTELKTHMRYHTGEKAYVCDTCGKGYTSHAEFSRHKNRHDQNPKFKCEICLKPFYEKRKVREHMTVHSHSRDEICNVCNKGFASIKHLRQHQLIHNPEKKYECEICKKRFAQCAGLTCHMKSHGTKFTTIDPGNFIFE